MRTKAGLLLVFVAATLVAQGKAPKAQVKGDCNGTASGSNITIIVRCEDGISAEDTKKLAQQYAEILKRIRQENLKFDDVIGRLKGIQDSVSDIRTTVQGRHLSEKQLTALKTIAATQDFSRQSFVFSYIAESETRNFAHEFMSALAIPEKWTNVILNSGQPHVGVELAISAQDARNGYIPSTCGALLKLFTDEHIIFSIVPDPPVTHGQCSLTIGEKPRI